VLKKLDIYFDLNLNAMDTSEFALINRDIISNITWQTE